MVKQKLKMAGKSPSWELWDTADLVKELKKKEVAHDKITQRIKKTVPAQHKIKYEKLWRDIEGIRAELKKRNAL